MRPALHATLAVLGISIMLTALFLFSTTCGWLFVVLCGLVLAVANLAKLEDHVNEQEAKPVEPAEDADR